MPLSGILGRGKGLSGSKIALKYFTLGATGGRGSVVRYMLYVHDIDFEDIKVKPDDSWKALKEELISSGHNPCGGLPVLYIDDKPYFGHIPILRYLAAKVLSEYTDEYTGWRNDWAGSLFDEAKKKEYTAKREKIYALMERLYGMRKDKSTPFIMAMDKPGYDDLCVYAMIYDDYQFCGEMNMDAYPTLKQLYDRIKVIPKIAEWIKQAAAEPSGH